MHPAARVHVTHSETAQSERRGEQRILDATDLAPSSSALSELTPASILALTSLLTPRAFQKDEWILRGGERAEFLFFIARGLVRELYVDSGGSEHTRTFIREGMLTGSLVDLISRRPAIT